MLSILIITAALALPGLTLHRTLRGMKEAALAPAPVRRTNQSFFSPTGR